MLSECDGPIVQVRCQYDITKKQLSSFEGTPDIIGVCKDTKTKSNHFELDKLFQGVGRSRTLTQKHEVQSKILTFLTPTIWSRRKISRTKPWCLRLLKTFNISTRRFYTEQMFLKSQTDKKVKSTSKNILFHRALCEKLH